MYVKPSKLRRKSTKKRSSKTKTSSRWYSMPRWRRTRSAFLKRDLNGFCYYHRMIGKGDIPSTVVDHIIRREAGGSSYDNRNLRGSCDVCHNIKRHYESIEINGVDMITAMIPKQRTANGLIPLNTVKLDVFLTLKLRTNEARKALDNSRKKSWTSPTPESSERQETNVDEGDTCCESTDFCPGS